MTRMIASLRAALGAGIVALAVLAAGPSAGLDIQDLRSPEGAAFWLVEEPSIPIVALEISFAGGARLDPADRTGLANLAAALLDEGAGDLDSEAFATARDTLAARFGFSAGRDSLEVSAQMLVETLEPSVELLASALAAPRFDPERLELVRAQVLAVLAEAGVQPDTIAANTWNARAFPDHPYGRPANGTPESVAAITRDDLIAARTRLLTRANARIAVVGAIGAEQAGRMVDVVRLRGAFQESLGAIPACAGGRGQRTQAGRQGSR
jgi:zinc protease